MALDEARELDEDITMRRMTLTRTRGDGGSAGDDSQEAPRLVCHYQYHAWPDHGIPETTRPLRRLAHLLVNLVTSPADGNHPADHHFRKRLAGRAHSCCSDGSTTVR